MVDCGGFKTKLKKKRRRSDEGKTRDRRRLDGEKKIWTTLISSIFDSKGVGCAKYEGIGVNP